MAAERITVFWCVKEHKMEVLRRYKNGRIRVAYIDNLGVMGGRAGSVKQRTMSIEPWMEVKK